MSGCSLSSEKMLVLGIAEPHLSRKYKVAICVTGITIHGQFRRVYSIPLRDYYRSPFKKFQYIRYDVLGRGSDSRPESRRIDMQSIEPLEFASPLTVAQKIRDYKSPSLEYLQQRTRSSLGIIKPTIDSHEIEYRDYQRTATYSSPRSAKRIINLLPFWVKFEFHCRSRGCRGHWIMCQDQEIGNYYRRLWNQIHGRKTAKKVEDKLNHFLSEEIPYFVMGTHIQYKSAWLIISIINPRAKHFYA